MRIRVIFSFFIIAFLLAVQAVAQTEAIVREIEVQYAGAANISKERILANMRTQVGRPYSEQAVEEDIRTLYSTGNITNVRIFGEPVRDGVKVVVVVQTKATIGEVVINGVTKLRVNRLRKDLTAKQGEALSEAALEQDRQKILEEYQKRGFTDTQVTYVVETNESTGSTRVVFNVAESGKTAISDVRIEGNEAFSDRELRRLMKTKPQNMLSFLTKAGRLQNDQLQNDVSALREHYQNKGYLDVEIPEPVIERRDNGKVEVVIQINEGGQYRAGNVAVEGANVFTADEVRARVKTSGNAIYSPAQVRADVKSIQDLYGTRGYLDLQANAITTSSAPGVIDMTYRIDEGAQSYIEQINIQGNTRTKDKVIRRELAVAPGDVYDTVRVDASKQRLQNLRYFKRIDAFPTETLIPGRRDLNVIVEEDKTGNLNFGAGFSSVENLLGFVELQQSNFDITRWPDFTGGGQRFRTRVQYGAKRKDFVMSLTEPYFLDYRLSLGGEVFYREATFVSTVYSQRNYGFSINSRKPLTQNTFVRLDYRLENIGIFDVDEDASLAIRQEEGDRLKSSITAGITYDTRDSLFLTRRGQRVDFSTYVAGGPLGGDTQIYGFNLTGSKYFPLPFDTIFSVVGEVASVDTWGSGDRVPIFDRLFLGGPDNLRGFKYREVGPKDEDDEPLGGGSLARLSLEYTFPIIERIRGAMFYDVGFVNPGAYEFSPTELASDVGIGMRVELPIGPVRFDYGIPVSGDAGGGGRFNFKIDYQY
jgi:outer membrane protein insertion porin family